DDPFNPDLPEQGNNEELPHLLALEKEVFGKASPAPKPAARRCVFVLSADCKAPPAVKAWEGLQVHVILVEVTDAAPDQAPPSSPTAQRWADWDRLCRRHQGAAFLVRVRARGAVLPHREDRDALEQRLHWAISPF